jgi:hypothetical protein
MEVEHALTFIIDRFCRRATQFCSLVKMTEMTAAEDREPSF